MSRWPLLDCTAFWLCQSIRKKKTITPVPRNTYQLLLGTVRTHNKKGKTGQRTEHGVKRSVGAYRKIEVIWYHGLLSVSDRRAHVSSDR